MYKTCYAEIKAANHKIPSDLNSPGFSHPFFVGFSVVFFFSFSSSYSTFLSPVILSLIIYPPLSSLLRLSSYFSLSPPFSFYSFSSLTLLLSPLFASSFSFLLFSSFITLDFISFSVLSVVFLTSFSFLLYPSFFSVLSFSLSSVGSVVLPQRESHFINNRCLLAQHRLPVVH